MSAVDCKDTNGVLADHIDAFHVASKCDANGKSVGSAVDRKKLFVKIWQLLRSYQLSSDCESWPKGLYEILSQYNKFISATNDQRLMDQYQSLSEILGKYREACRVAKLNGVPALSNNSVQNEMQKFAVAFTNIIKA